MTKLDRAFNNEEELLKLSRYYEALNITALDLFKVLKRVRQSIIVRKCNTMFKNRILKTDCAILYRSNFGLQLVRAFRTVYAVLYFLTY